MSEHVEKYLKETGKEFYDELCGYYEPGYVKWLEQKLTATELKLENNRVFTMNVLRKLNAVLGINENEKQWIRDNGVKIQGED